MKSLYRILGYIREHKKLKIAIFMVYDVLAVFAASYLSFVTLSVNAFDLYWKYRWVSLSVAIGLVLVGNFTLSLYSYRLHSAGIGLSLKLAVVVAVRLLFGILYEFCSGGQYYVSVLVESMLLYEFLQIGRFAVLAIRHVIRFFASHRPGCTRLMIVGAGEAGRLLIAELKRTERVTMKPICIVDDDANKHGQLISGVPVVGSTSEIAAMVTKYRIDRIIVAMPSVPRMQVRSIYSKCCETGLPVQTMPGIYQFATGEVSLTELREVSPEELLGREQVSIDLDLISAYLTDKVVLVTGGGGSIGSELCRQIANHKPRQLLILDIYENNAYDIEQELRRKFPELPIVALIASVRDSKKIDNVFATYRPNIVFHAAAHKHVPLMETSPNEAIKNNVFGTYKVAKAADKYGASRFVLISTDKAVNPTNIMGASKRICEMIIQSFASRSKTEFAAVRFGNVLGSNGSVIPLFKKQIAEGGPVTVTHKDIIRYFMTIPEAVSLVLQAGVYARGGEIFVLNMGEPVKIYDLACNLIRLSGLEPNVDIEIKCTGLRPGEKLYEELLMDEEGLRETANHLIFIGKPLDIDPDVFFEKLDALYDAAYSETTEMRAMVQALVPTYKPQSTT